MGEPSPEAIAKAERWLGMAPDPTMTEELAEMLDDFAAQACIRKAPDHAFVTEAILDTERRAILARITARCDLGDTGVREVVTWIEGRIRGCTPDALGSAT